MDKLQEIVQLCLPRLTPGDTCMLSCTCLGLQRMRLSWRDHSVDFELAGSATATAWLHKHIASMQKLRLKISFKLPRETLQDVLKEGR